MRHRNWGGGGNKPKASNPRLQFLGGGGVEGTIPKLSHLGFQFLG